VPNNAVLENYSDIGAEVKQEDYSNLGTEVAPVVPELRNAPPATFIDKMKSFFTDPEKDIAKAQNVYALSEVTGLQLKDVYNNYDLLRRSSKVTGITPDLERREYMAIAMTPFIATAAVLNPIGTTAGLLAYAALDKAIPTDKIIKGVEKGIGGELSDTTKTTIDLLDFLGKGLIVGGVFKQAPKLAEGFMKQKLIEYNLAKDIKLSKEQVRDIFQTGKLTTAEEQSLFGSLNLKGQELRNTLTEGVKITIPAEKLTTLVDKPIWAKIKSVIGMESKPKVTSELAGKPAKAVSGLLGQAITPETPIVAPNKPITAPIAPKVVENPLPLAIRLKSGEVISDATAKLHSDIVTAKGINPDDVVDVGYMEMPQPTEGKVEYRSTHQIDTNTASPITQINEENLNSFITEFKNQYGYPALKSKEVNKLKSIMSNPDADITIYRASPKNELNSGDWVTIDKDYANDIRKQNGGKVYAHTVKAKELFYPKTLEGFKDLPSLNKWGAFQYQSKLSTPTGEGKYIPTKLPDTKGGAPLETLPQVPEELMNKVKGIIGTGGTKTRGLAKGVEEKAIENKLTDTFGGLPEYQTVNMKEQAGKAQDLLTNDYEKARRIAMGEELSPSDVLPESVFVAVENKAVAEQDVATLKDLATSSGLSQEATTMGQRIRTLAERNPESPVTAINEVGKVRKEVAQKRLKTKEVNKIQKEEIKSIKEHIKKVAPTKESWSNFIRSIQC
jgi:hypothetical protein